MKNTFVGKLLASRQEDIADQLTNNTRLSTMLFEKDKADLRAMIREIVKEELAHLETQSMMRRIFSDKERQQD